MNPPFVSARELPEADRRSYHSAYGAKLGIGKNADLWVYFVIKSLDHLRSGGSVAAILPWSLLRAVYAKELRLALCRRFRKIKVLLLTEMCFPSTPQRVALVWLDGYGGSCSEIRFGVSSRPRQPATYQGLSRRVWVSGEALEHTCGLSTDIASRLRDEFGFERLDAQAEVAIGVVTGANGFFVLSEGEAKGRGFHHSNLAPILVNSREIGSLVTRKRDTTKRLLKLSQPCPSRYADYLRQGEKRGIPEMTHPARRSPWYAVDVGRTPDAFFPYRVSRFPFMSLNPDGVQCTNSIHRVYLNGATPMERQWMQVSLLSRIGQLCLEASARTYGHGVLKVEPSHLKRALVHRGKPDSECPAYDEVSELLSAGRRREAVDAASACVERELGIPSSLSETIREALGKVQSWRKPQMARAGRHA